MSGHGSVISDSDESLVSDIVDDGDSAGGSADGDHSNHTKSSNGDTETSIGKQETNIFKRCKVAMLFVLVAAAAACGTISYHFTKIEDQHEFQAKFNQFASKFVDQGQHDATNTLRQVKIASSSITSLAKQTKSIWPFLTIPHFELRARNVNEITPNAILTGFSPLVHDSNKYDWELYSVLEEDESPAENNNNNDIDGSNTTERKISNVIYRLNDFDDNEPIYYDKEAGPYLPVWQVAGPAVAVPGDKTSIINYNLLSNPFISNLYSEMLRLGGKSVLSPAVVDHSHLNFLYGSSNGKLPPNITSDEDDGANNGTTTSTANTIRRNPHSILLEPVYESFASHENYKGDNAIKGVIYVLLSWDEYFNKILALVTKKKGEVSPSTKGREIHIVLKNTCGGTFTYQLGENRKEARYIGEGDLHETKYNNLKVTAPFNPCGGTTINLHGGHDDHDHDHDHDDTEVCEFVLDIYPTKQFEDIYTTKKPIISTIIVLLVFMATVTILVMYDVLVMQRQNRALDAVKRTDAIVSSLFPSNVRDRIMKDSEAQYTDENGFRLGVDKKKLKKFLDNNHAGIETDLENNNGNHGVHGSKPIADLFPAATLMFADIVGFTAWSSVREPCQVFQLLESFFHAFDQIANRRHVFKVETVGDCYVAVTGLPHPRQDHAIVMARFARDCISKTNDLSKKLEVSLGPDTGDLALRVGLHSGAVTAGVLRGDKARFQLFGDTVNTASRIESNSVGNRIHISKETADLLREAGKSHWLVPRTDKVVAKGKGELQTYWLEVGIQTSTSTVSGSTETSGLEKDESSRPGQTVVPNTNDHDNSNNTLSDDPAVKGAKPVLSERVERLVQWNVDVLTRILTQIIAKRNATLKFKRGGERYADSAEKMMSELNKYKEQTVIDEVKEIITLPRFDPKVARKQEDPSNVKLSQEVQDQLHDYVTITATMYRDNPFHNFEHASHVAMSVAKLLSRIVAPEEELINIDTEHNTNESSTDIGKHLHDHTYGITTDPLTQFAVIFSALIHDVDHTGVPNAQLVKEKASIAAIYKNKSIAEQNSVDIAWDLLLDENFNDLRNAIYSNNAELKRFRQLVVNTVMATDIVDPELKALRNARWDKAFHKKSAGEKETRDDINRKATIVIEHLIQASDVAHTMQHWHIYRKWNERFFQEMLRAYKSGRSEKNPSEFWYKGELGFFDFYIIPLAKKLKECGVFGVSSDEYLNYAITNRKEWELKGEDVVAEMEKNYKHSKLSYTEIVDKGVKLGENESPEEKHGRTGRAYSVSE